MFPLELCVPLESLDCGPESQEYLSLAGLHLMHELVSGNPFSLIGELSRFRAFPWVSVHAMELLRCVGVSWDGEHISNHFHCTVASLVV